MNSLTETVKKYWLILLIGLLVRLIIAGFSFHPDVTTPAVASGVVFREGSLNFYKDSANLDQKEVLDDLPLSYLISLPLHLIVRPLVSENVETTFFQDRSTLFGEPSFWLYLIYIKFPMIIFDLALGILLAASLENLQKRILVLWMFNPITLWATAAVGQVDIYPTFFIVLAWVLIKKNKLSWAALSLGTGGAIKSAPFLLVPLLIGLGKNWKERINIAVLASLPYIVTVLPYLGGREFRQNALLAPQFSKIFYANIPLSGGEAILIVPAIILFLYFFYFSKKREALDFLLFSLSILLSVLAFTHFHLQWLLWVTPFLLFWLINNKDLSSELAAYGLFGAWTLMLFLFESSLQLKLFTPLFPPSDQAVGLSEILSNNQVIFLRSITASIFSASSVFLIWKIAR